MESRCVIEDPAAGITRTYYQCGSCKSEDTFAHKDLFLDPNYDFLPVFSDVDCVIFRRHAQCRERYREVRPIEGAWDGTVPCLETFRGRLLSSPDAIFEAMDRGLSIVGRTEIRDEDSGRVALIEYPVKTINWHRDEKLFQVDTGPVVLPDLSLPPEQWSEGLRLAFVAFNATDWADFIVEVPTPVETEDGKTAEVYHYSERLHMTAQNALFALD